MDNPYLTNPYLTNPDNYTVVSRLNTASGHEVVEAYLTDYPEQKTYSYFSPTHWGSTGVASINSRGHLAWSSGGTNSEYSKIEIAEAMATVWTMVANRLKELEK